MYNAPLENGNANYRSWVQIPEADADGIIEGLDSIPFEDRKYARLVQIVGGSSGSGSSPVSTSNIAATQSVVYEVADGITNIPAGFDRVWCFSSPLITDISIPDPLDVPKWQIFVIDNIGWGQLLFLDGVSTFIHEASVAYINSLTFKLG